MSLLISSVLNLLNASVALIKKLETNQLALNGLGESNCVEVKFGEFCRSEIR